MIVVRNKMNELIPTQTVTDWKMCIDYRRLNKVTRKDHFPLPFYGSDVREVCRSDILLFSRWLLRVQPNCSGPADHEKTAFTCPFGVFTYRRMPFGLSNTSSTFQRCMLSRFSDIIESSIEVFMDDFFFVVIISIIFLHPSMLFLRDVLK